jgi:hypothetical protein
MNPILLIQNYLGRELTVERVRALSTAPHDHITGLLEAVERFGRWSMARPRFRSALGSGPCGFFTISMA